MRLVMRCIQARVVFIFLFILRQCGHQAGTLGCGRNLGQVVKRIHLSLSNSFHKNTSRRYCPRRMARHTRTGGRECSMVCRTVQNRQRAIAFEERNYARKNDARASITKGGRLVKSMKRLFKHQCALRAVANAFAAFDTFFLIDDRRAETFLRQRVCRADADGRAGMVLRAALRFYSQSGILIGDFLCSEQNIKPSSE